LRGEGLGWAVAWWISAGFGEEADVGGSWGLEGYYSERREQVGGRVIWWDGWEGVAREEWRDG
jgi:hypothetical protein